MLYLNPMYTSERPRTKNNLAFFSSAHHCARRSPHALAAAPGSEDGDDGAGKGKAGMCRGKFSREEEGAAGGREEEEALGGGDVEEDDEEESEEDEE